MAAKRKQPPRRATVQPTIHMDATLNEGTRRHDWQSYGKTLTFSIGMVTAGILSWNYAQALFESGPLPVPSRAEVRALDMKIELTKKEAADTAREIVGRLEALDKRSDDIARKARTDLSEALANRTRNLQGLIDLGKLDYEKDPSAANQRKLDTLTMAMDDLQRQIRDNLAESR